MAPLSLRGALLGLAAALLAGPVAAADVEEVRRCVEENAPARSAVMTLDITTQPARGGPSTSRLKLYWLRDGQGETRALLRFLRPDDLSGSAVLIEDLRDPRPRVHLYLPDLRRAQRITSREQLEGALGRSSLGLEEISVMLDPIAEKELELVEGDRTPEDGSSWTLEQRRDDGAEGGVLRVRTLVERRRCLPVRVELIGDAGVLRRVDVDTAHVRRFAESWIPLHIDAHDLETGSVTRIRVDQVEVDIPLAPGLLTVKALGAVR